MFHENNKRFATWEDEDCCYYLHDEEERGRKTTPLSKYTDYWWRFYGIDDIEMFLDTKVFKNDTISIDNALRMIIYFKGNAKRKYVNTVRRVYGGYYEALKKRIS